jgi:hypothetical protein
MRRDPLVEFRYADNCRSGFRGSAKARPELCVSDVSSCTAACGRLNQRSKYSAVNVGGWPRRSFLPLLRIASATC